MFKVKNISIALLNNHYVLFKLEDLQDIWKSHVFYTGTVLIPTPQKI